jgi:GT2 family glycosyltransferase
MTTRTPTVDVIVVMWKSFPYLEDLFAGFAAMDYPREAVTIHIVDNQSPDGAGEDVKRRLAHPDARWPKIVLHEPGANLGFSAGNNLVMRNSTADYCYLLNHDAIFEAGTLREAVAVAEAHPNAGSVQSLMVLAQDPMTLNSIGNDIHFAGFGYCRGYKLPTSSAPDTVTLIAYASGAAVLYRTSVLRQIGLLDETLFAYHEDLDLGWRILLAGYDNLLAPKSVLRHRYEFSRSIAKWYWMERNRFIVLFKNERWGTLLLTLPALIVIELATWLFALKGGWGKEKWRACAWFFKPSSWSYLFRARRETQRLRKTTDRRILKRYVSEISYQEVSSGFIRSVANPLMALYFSILKAIIIW